MGLTKNKELRIGMIGCGRIAEHHARFVTQSGRGRLVAVADVSQERAAAFARRWGAANCYDSLEAMLIAGDIDVLHVLTPPGAHMEQATAAIERGVNVLLEKPVAFSAAEVEALYQRARQKAVLVCVDFAQLFAPPMLKATRVVNSGLLGLVRHVEAYFGFDLRMPELREGIQPHWSFDLPGGVLHNYLTHPLYLAIQWTGVPSTVTVHAKAYGTLPQNLTDHMVVHLAGPRCTGTVVATAAAFPDGYWLKLICERGTVLVNFASSTVVVQSGTRLPRLVARATANFRESWQLLVSGLGNMAKFLTGKLVPYQGLGELIDRFYAAILQSGNAPVAPDLAVGVTRVEEMAFQQGGKLKLDLSDRPSRQRNMLPHARILVTGAAGYIGRHLIKHLASEGYCVRALLRPTNRVELLEEYGVELVFGDVRHLPSLRKACDGINVVVHLAAALRGRAEYMLQTAVQGTANLATAAQEAGVQRVIYMSSLAVYDYAALHDGEIITEASPLESRPELRGPASLAKRRAEDVALSHLRDALPTWTIVRPSFIVGGGRDVYSAVGIKVGSWLFCLGGPGKNLRLIHLHDVATALSALLRTSPTTHGVYTLSHPESITIRDYVKRCVKRQPGSPRVVYVPFAAAVTLASIFTGVRRLVRRGPHISVSQLRYLYSGCVAGCANLAKDTNWVPDSGLLDRLSGDE